MENIVHQLAMLYISKQDIVNITPEQLANQYLKVYEQIYKVLVTKAKPYKESRFSSY